MSRSWFGLVGPSRLVAGVFLLAASLLSTGCISVKSYVDPALPKVEYAQIKPAANKYPVQLLFEFQSKDSTNFSATKALRPHFVAVLERSNLFSQVVAEQSTAERKLYVTVKNFPVTEDAMAKGFGTGLTFGLVGSLVTDGYAMDAIYQRPGRQEVRKTYRHALHSTIGNADGPAGLQPMTVQDGVNKVMEEFMLNLLHDLSKEGAI